LRAKPLEKNQSVRLKPFPNFWLRYYNSNSDEFIKAEFRFTIRVKIVEDEMIKDKKMIKRDILDQFRARDVDEEYILPAHWLESDYVKDLDTEERKLFKKAIDELISMGIVENVKGADLSLKLTRKGADLIY